MAGGAKLAREIGASIKGVDEILRKLEATSERFAKAIRDGLNAWGENTISISKEVCPYRWGHLRASGKSEMIKSGGADLVELSYGGESPADAYAIYVHEIPARHAPGKIQKYLEVPTLRESKKLPSVIGAIIKRDVLK